MKNVKIILVFAIMLLVTNVFSAIGYETFTVQENEVFTKVLVKVSREFKSLDRIFDIIERNYNNYLGNTGMINNLLNFHLSSNECLNNILIYNDKNEITNTAKAQYNIGAQLFSDNQGAFDNLFGDTYGFSIPVKTDRSYIPVIYITKPIKDSNGRIIGRILMSVDTLKITANISSIISNYDINIVICDNFGTLVYDLDMEEIGRNTLTDPMYKNFTELRELFEKRIIVEKNGEGSYSFYSTGMNQTQKKLVKWNTLEVFGGKLKVCMNSERN